MSTIDELQRKLDAIASSYSGGVVCPGDGKPCFVCDVLSFARMVIDRLAAAEAVCDVVDDKNPEPVIDRFSRIHDVVVRWREVRDL